MADARPLALITGASSGIGAALARRFAAGGHDLVLSARREDRLATLAAALAADGARTTVLPADLAAADGPSRLVAAMAERSLAPDVLVNNAGFGQRGDFAQAALARQLAMLQLNVAALTELAGLLLPGMLARRRGRILNVASTAAFQPGPRMAVYYASKAYVLNFSEALAYELRGSGVTVTALCPGPTVTEFAAAADMDDTLLFSLMPASAERVAKVGYRATMAGRPRAFVTLKDALGAGFARLAPHALLLPLVSRLQA